ncbi:hypothetical protein DK867_03445 [Ochrobactrum sp. POC9]|nr:hypothetical protein DK867_03445 [Ochrobactrum sp. POC9]
MRHPVHAAGNQANYLAKDPDIGLIGNPVLFYDTQPNALNKLGLLQFPMETCRPKSCNCCFDFWPLLPAL